jgi:hypothetical protein
MSKSASAMSASEYLAQYKARKAEEKRVMGLSRAAKKRERREKARAALGIAPDPSDGTELGTFEGMAVALAEHARAHIVLIFVGPHARALGRRVGTALLPLAKCVTQPCFCTPLPHTAVSLPVLCCAVMCCVGPCFSSRGGCHRQRLREEGPPTGPEAEGRSGR